MPVLFSRLRSGRLRYPSSLLGSASKAWDDLKAMADAGKLTPGQIQTVEAFDSTSSVNNSEGFFQL